MNAPTKVEVKTLASAMADAFAEFESAAKDANNPHFKSKYADLPAVIAAIKPALINHRLFFTQTTHEVEGGVCVETSVHHESGDSMSFGKLFVPASKHDAHGYGSALTYARRYSLMTAFGVPADDDDGNAASKTIANDRNGDAEKVPGIHKIKERLRTLKTAGDMIDADEVSALEVFKELKRANKADLKTIRDANHSWWTGDGEDFEGYGPWIERREAELSADDGQSKMLVTSMKECGTLQALTNWMAANESMIDELDDPQRRKWELAYNLHESAILAAATASA